MLGERGTGMVTQNAWVRALTATTVKSWEGPGIRIGGLFGAPAGDHELVLPWNRAQQAAFLIFSWKALAGAIFESNPEWVYELEDENSIFHSAAVALESQNSLLNSEMGVRGFLYVLNDLCFVRVVELELRSWEPEQSASATAADAVYAALDSLAQQPVATFIGRLTESLARYDWRSSKAPHLDSAERQRKARFRGGTGYRELREELLQHIETDLGLQDNLGLAASEVISRLGYDR